MLRWHVGDVIGCYIDLTDLNQTRIGYTQNGVDLGIIFTTTIKPATGISPSLSCDWLQSATVNFGATPFKYAICRLLVDFIIDHIHL